MKSPFKAVQNLISLLKPFHISNLLVKRRNHLTIDTKLKLIRDNLAPKWGACAASKFLSGLSRRRVTIFHLLKFENHFLKISI